MNSNFALIDGNLALSGSFEAEPSSRNQFQTEIYDLPVRPTRPTHVVSTGSSATSTVCPPVRLTASSSKHFEAASSASTVQQVLRVVACACILLALFGSLFFAAYSVLSSKTSGYEFALEHTELTSISVKPGDSLWVIAEEHGVEGMTTQETTELIRMWNDLDTSTLQPGMELLVPALVG